MSHEVSWHCQKKKKCVVRSCTMVGAADTAGLPSTGSLLTQSRPFFNPQGRPTFCTHKGRLNFCEHKEAYLLPHREG